MKNKEPIFSINTILKDPTSGKSYNIRKMIGIGAYAQCYLAYLEKKPFALKIIDYNSLKSEKVREKLKSEIQIHSSLNHPNIVRLYAHFTIDKYVIMVMELCERGALDELLKRNKTLKEKYVKKFLLQILNGLKYLHFDKNIVHRDLKLGNLFLDSQLNIKIGDFGLSAIIRDGERRKTVCGTPNYIAPEVLFGKAGGHSYEADIWSVGVIIYTLLIGTPPFQQKNVKEIYKMIEKGTYIFPNDCNISDSARLVITDILNTNPDGRPTIEELESHSFLYQSNLAKRVIDNITSYSYKITDLTCDYVVFSLPLSIFNGIGYLLKSGVVGIYYYNNENYFIRNNTLYSVLLNKRILNEHLIDDMSGKHAKYYNDIIFFAKNYAKYVTFENTINSKAVIAKIKKIDKGFLFLMTNNSMVFDLENGTRVAISKEGREIFCFNEKGPIEFSLDLKKTILNVLEIYSNK